MLFFSLFLSFWFWFEVGVGFFPRYLSRAEKSLVHSPRRAAPFRHHTPSRFEVGRVPMARADTRVRSLCGTNAQNRLVYRLLKRSRRHGKTAARPGCLLPKRAVSRFALRPGYP